MRFPAAIFASFFLLSILFFSTGRNAFSKAPPAGNDEDNLKEMTLTVAGAGCETNLNEAELLRVAGVVSVDIEMKPGKYVLWYDQTFTNKNQIKTAVGVKKGGCAADEEVIN